MLLIYDMDILTICFILAQTAGSGKTFTMEGSKMNSQYGISQRTIQKIFSLLQDKAHQHQRNNQDGESSPHFEYKIQVGMLEIYNDEGMLIHCETDQFVLRCQPSHPLIDVATFSLRPS